MAGKSAVYPLVMDHVRTLRHADSPDIRVRDLATHYGLPLLIAVLVILAGLRLADAGQIIAGASILAGFSFGTAIFVFQLRLESARDPRIGKGARLLDLLDELFTNVTYLILIGLLLVALTIAATSFTRPPPKKAALPTIPPGAEALGSWWTLLIVALALHYLVTLLMCVKRISRAYEELTI